MPVLGLAEQEDGGPLGIAHADRTTAFVPVFDRHAHVDASGDRGLQVLDSEDQPVRDAGTAWPRRSDAGRACRGRGRQHRGDAAHSSRRLMSAAGIVRAISGGVGLGHKTRHPVPSYRRGWELEHGRGPVGEDRLQAPQAAEDGDIVAARLAGAVAVEEDALLVGQAAGLAIDDQLLAAVQGEPLEGRQRHGLGGRVVGRRSDGTGRQVEGREVTVVQAGRREEIVGGVRGPERVHRLAERHDELDRRPMDAESLEAHDGRRRRGGRDGAELSPLE